MVPKCTLCMSWTIYCPDTRVSCKEVLPKDPGDVELDYYTGSVSSSKGGEPLVWGQVQLQAETGSPKESPICACVSCDAVCSATKT